MENIASLSASIMYDYKVINTTENHTWIADESLLVGGQDEGPNPKELFLSSLASCILITLRIYSQKRNWEVGDIHIDLSLNQLENGTEIVKDITFSGNLEDEQILKLKEISNRCPVAKILSNPIEFKFA